MRVAVMYHDEYEFSGDIAAGDNGAVARKPRIRHMATFLLAFAHADFHTHHSTSPAKRICASQSANHHHVNHDALIITANAAALRRFFSLQPAASPQGENGTSIVCSDYFD